MNKYRKWLFSILGVLFVILLTVVHSFWISPSRFKIRKEILSSKQIPKSLHNLRILYFSDLQYGEFMNQKRLHSLVKQINSLQADVVLFGGDVYSTIAKIDIESNKQIQSELSSIQAKYGKFAVLGDQDEMDKQHLQAVQSVLTQSNFEILKNQSVLLHKGEMDSIALVGLANGITSSIDAKKAYENLMPTHYVLAFSHTPDSAKQVPPDLTDYYLAGHSLGGQIYYLFGSLSRPIMAKEIFRGKSSIKGKFDVDVTNGVGTIKKDIRFLSPAEMVLYTLKKD
ncbi:MULTISPECIES: metallophosphoesterase [Terrabacteria group]|uniref:metallophosphoesterase n=1 Tax=Bacillati TaxID=1783272 RepID=UPI001C6EBA1B|nr:MULTISPECIES: hypothetical protein [Terrabacteria group]MBW9213057.1 hypothetical protein [Trueperella sp. zg.1013]